MAAYYYYYYYYYYLLVDLSMCVCSLHFSLRDAAWLLCLHYLIM